MKSCNGLLQDYTLAQYKPETFEHLAYSQTVQKLREKFGYPDDLAHLNFDWQYMMRGLTIDKRRGNIIKVCVAICCYLLTTIA
jgi:5'-nucleotidase